MPAEKPDTWLVDLLYEEERGEDASPEALDHEDLTEEERETYDQTRSWLTQARSALDEGQEEPPAHIHTSLMEAARKQAEAQATEQARAADGRRPPQDSRSADSSIWGSSTRARLVQFVAAATVCVVAGYLATQTMGSNEAPASRAASTEAMAEQEIAFDEAAPVEAEEAPPQDVAAAESESAPDSDDFPEVGEQERERIALADSKDEEEATELSEDRREGDNTLNKKKLALKDEEKPRPAAEARAARKRTRAGKDPPPQRAPRSRTAPKPSKKMKDKKSLSADSVLGGADQEERRSGRGMNDIFTSPEAPAKEAPTEESQTEQAPRSPSPNKGADTVGNASEAEREQGSPAAEPVPRDANKRDDDADTAAAAPAQTHQAAEPAPATLSEVERARRRGNNRATVETADAYLSRGIGTNRERARALEIKAEALANLGRTSESREIYEIIEQNYPDYYRKEKVREKRRSKQKKRRAPEVDRSSDQLFESESAPTKAY